MRKRTKLVYGVGINDANYRVRIVSHEGGKQKVLWSCPFYDRWANLLLRCYNKKELEKHPTYQGCSICEDWVYFSNFRRWMFSQNWEGKQLDKDILFPNNKVYSPETCVFVSQEVNKFLTDRRLHRGDLPIGVYWCKKSLKYKVQISFKGRRVHLGMFSNLTLAEECWRKEKLRLAHILAEEQDDIRVARALISRYENYEK